MMKFKTIALFIILLSITKNYAQLGFCTGSKGDAIFSENFGNGIGFGPALPVGVTNYKYISGAPNDGFYTLYYKTNLYDTWHFSLDHSPDATNGAGGKALIVNADASTSGDFYKRKVTGLCINTTFEFSAWLMNIYKPSSNFCGASEIPINVKFEIWNETETILLSSGDTGNIKGTAAPLWQQFALVFTTVNETSVVLKMKNNGVGGCGNDLAIDDIEFRSCGELTTISSPFVSGNDLITCVKPISVEFNASTAGSATYFYQWQNSTDNVNWVDISGATGQNYITPNLTTATFYRTKIAQDVTNINNDFCSTVSNVFSISFTDGPKAAISNGDVMICSNETIPALSVTSEPGTSVNWYSAATAGILLKANSKTYTPLKAGTYYTEVYDIALNCLSDTRTAVSLTIVPLPTATISVISPVCSGNTSSVTFNGTPNAIVNYTIDGGSKLTTTLSTTGTSTINTPNLTTNSTYNLVSVSSAVLNSCINTINSAKTIVVNPLPTATVSAESAVCYGSDANLLFTGTPNATVTYVIDNGSNQTVTLNSSGQASVKLSNLLATKVITLKSATLTSSIECAQVLSQSISIIVNSMLTATITANPMSICSNQSTTLTFIGTPNATVFYTTNNTNSPSVTLDNAGKAIVSISNLNANTTFKLTNIVSNATNCSQLLTDSVKVTVNQSPKASFTGDLIYCSGESTLIQLQSDIAGTTFSWTTTHNNTTGAISGSGNQILEKLETVSNANGSVIYTVTPESNGCIGSPFLINVTVNALPIPNIQDGVICLFGSNSSATEPYILNTGLNATDFSFQWFFNGNIIPNAFGNTYQAYQIGAYNVIVTNIISGCISDSDSATVTEKEQGESLNIQQSDSFSNSPTVTVNVVGGEGPFLYKIDDTDFQSSNVFYNVSGGEHLITVVDDVYCTFLTETISVIVYPKFFTPNGDGYNDTWNISGFNTNAKITIYNKYGKLIKQIFSNDSGWDGTYDGQLLSSTDYWFTVNYVEDGVEKLFRAHFSLKR